MWSVSGDNSHEKRHAPKGGFLLDFLIEMGREINTTLQVLPGLLLENIYILITYVSERWINLKW